MTDDARDPADRQPPDAPAEAAEPSPAVSEEHDERGLDLARSIARGLAGRTGPVRKRLRNTRRVDPVSSSAHPDDRDPQSLGATLGRLVDSQGWETELRVHGVFTRWAAVVGAEVAAHVTPESYADGRLLVRTDSTAWATQVKLLAGNLVQRLNQDLGDGTVEVIDVLGPHTPRWTSGRFRVKGRGPRDTYG
jgi:predicted nucleic acid-binding Zn ribbon protein